MHNIRSSASFQLAVRQRGRIAGLDGLRAVSILFVVAGHLAGTQHCYSELTFNHLGDLANLGVRFFFVISGYLITFLLLKEHAATKSISLKSFYVRRTLRIFPAFYSYVLIMTLACTLGVVQFHVGDLLHAFTYTINYHYDRSWWVGHIWSLSVEEQFYLLWPVTLIFLGVRRGFKAAWVVVFAGPLIRLGVFYLWPAQRVGIGESFPTIADTIATGCLLAGYRDFLRQQRWYRWLMSSKLSSMIPILAVVLNMRPAGRLHYAVLDTCINLCVALSIARYTTRTDGFGHKLLSSRVLVYLGDISYSVYLWQQPFLNRHSHLWVAAFPVNIILTFAAALACHYFIEQPFLRLRDRSRTAGSLSSNVLFGPPLVAAGGESVNVRQIEFSHITTGNISKD